MIMFLFFKWLISPYFLSYSITNLLCLIGLTLTFISGILGIKAYSIELWNNEKQFSPNYNNFKSPTLSVCAIAAIYPFYFHLNIPLHILIRYHSLSQKKESVTSFMHQWLHVLLNGQPIEMKLCSKYVRTQR